MYLAFYLIVPTIAGHVKNIGGSDMQASLAVTLFSITSLVSRLLFGRVSDEIDKKPIMLAGVILCMLCMVLFFFTNVAGLLLVRLVHGIGWGISSVSIGAAFSDIIAPENRGEGLGYYSLTMVVSMSTAPLVAIIIMNAYGFPVILAMTLLLLASIILILKFTGISPSRGVKRHKVNMAKMLNFRDSFEKRALLPALLCFICVLPLCAVMSFIYLLGKEINMANIWVFFPGQVAIVLISRTFIGKVFDKKGHAYVIIPGAVSMGLGVFILSYARSVPALIIASLFFGFGYGATQPSLLAWAVNRSPSHRKGAATGTVLCAMDLSFTLGPVAFSMIVKNSSYSFMYRITPLLMVLFLVIFFLSIMHDKKVNSGG